MKCLFLKILSLLLIVVMLFVLFVGCANCVNYTVTFDSFGGTSIESQTVKQGECANVPENPVKDGFTFVEWQLDNSTFDFSTEITEDITLTAHYSINEGTEIVLITLDYHNGDISNIIEIKKGKTLSQPPVPKRSGYKFIGWYLDDREFDFSTEINDNIVITAKWEYDKTAQTSKNNSTDDSPNASEIATCTNNVDETASIDAIVNKYAGRWYLSGYKDVCIDVSKYKNYDAMVFEAFGFSLYWDNFSLSDQPTDEHYEFVIYPRKNCSGVYDTYSEILYDNFYKLLAEHKIVLGNDCFYINNNKFIRNAGNKNKYFDTCYPEALGTWYLYNNPNSKIIITTESKSNDLINGDTVCISAENFDFSTLGLNVSGNWSGVDASLNSVWDEFGISVNDDVLTVNNSNGIRKFYKTPIVSEVKNISLNSSNVELKVNDTHKLTAVIKPDDAYDKSAMWSSSNESVATVSIDGTVTAKAEGTAIITAKTKDGGHTASCKITVSVTHVSSISLNHTAVNATIGTNLQLIATVKPDNAYNKSVTWSSSDKSIAEVSSSGVVTPKKTGVAIITVTASDGGYMTSCTVTVKEPALEVKARVGTGAIITNDITVWHAYAEAEASGGSGEYVEYNVKLYYNGNLIAEDNDDSVSIAFVRSGTYMAIVYVKDSSGNEATSTATLKLE